MIFKRIVWLLALIGVIVLYGWAVQSIGMRPRPVEPESFAVALPPELQVGLSLGDRYLAANISSFRAIVLNTNRPDATTMHVLAKVQRGVSILNPAHEDNYYTAQALLPWAGEVDDNAFIQQRAMDSRTWDWLPGFFYAFNFYYFKQDYVKAGEVLAETAQRDPQNREALLAVAARWQEKGKDLDAAISFVQGMYAANKNKQLKQTLLQRLDRLKGLKALREAAALYKQKYGQPVSSLSDLVKAGLLTRLPEDPFGMGYTLDASGVPVIRKTQAPRPEKK